MTTPAKADIDADEFPVSASTAKQPKVWSRRIAADLVGIADLAAVIGGSMLPAIIYAQAGGFVTDWTLFLQSGFVAAIVTHMLLRLWGMYDAARIHDLPLHPERLMAAAVIGIALVSGLGLPHALREGHMWIWFAVALSGSYTLLLLVRTIAHPLLTYLTTRGRFDTRIAVFGAGHIARRVSEHLSRAEAGVRFVGVYDDRLGINRLAAEGLTVSGKLEDLVAHARKEHLDQIIIALPQSADRRIADVARKLEQLPVSIHIVTHIASDLVEVGPAHKVSAIGTVGLMDVKKKPLSDWAAVSKRLEDVLLGTALLIVALPLFPIIGLAIKLDSSGPVFFSQRRRGLNQAVFPMYKFRTMHVLEDGDDLRQATRNDERVTRVGRILRRTSMDELPQLFNVLKGEMSLVGPRPHAIAHDDRLGEMIESYVNRHQVVPGMTGLAQVSGLRGATSEAGSAEARVIADIHYIRNWSLWLDLSILTQTTWAVITGKNAH